MVDGGDIELEYQKMRINGISSLYKLCNIYFILLVSWS